MSIISRVFGSIDELGRMLDVCVLTELRNMLTEIEKEFGCKAMLSGGAIRDLIVFQNPKDLDVFLIGSEKSDRLAMCGDYASGMSLFEEPSNRRVLAIEAMSWPIEIIHTDPEVFKTPKSVLAGFGVDVSMVGVLSDLSVVTCSYTPPVEQYFEREYRVINKNRCDNRYRGRMADKGWKETE